MSALIVICGLSFAGKSTLAKALTTRFGYEEVDVDEVGAKMHNLDINDRALNDCDSDEIYDEADRPIESRLRSGVTVVDASRNPTREERARAREVAPRAHVRLLTIFVDTPEQVARQRRQNNQVTKARRDLSDDQFEEFNRVFQPPAEEERALVFRSGGRD